MVMTAAGRKEMTNNYDYKRYVGTDHRIVKIKSGVCFFCNKEGFVKMYRPDWIRYRNEMEKDPLERKPIQDILPDYSRSDREQLINGTHNICSQDAFGQYYCDHDFIKEGNSNIRCCSKCELWEDDIIK